MLTWPRGRRRKLASPDSKDRKRWKRSGGTSARRPTWAVLVKEGEFRSSGSKT